MTLVDAALVVLALAFVGGLVRAALGPTLADRAVAADVCLFIVVAALALLAVKLRQETFFDVILVATLLGFVGTASLARLVARRKRP